MKYVRVHEFVEALESLGIVFPKHSARATIHLEGGFGGVVRVDCEMFMESFVDVTKMSDSTKQVALTKEKVRKRFRLVEESDTPAPPTDDGGIVRRGI